MQRGMVGLGLLAIAELGALAANRLLSAIRAQFGGHGHKEPTRG
jgi:hypothetical protein